MRCIFAAIYLAIALLYDNDAPTVRAEGVLKNNSIIIYTERRGNAFD